MDVRCENCQTVYEFDEARVKEGGVTVKCTQCGHIFKVMRKRSVRLPRTLPGLAPFSEDTGDPTGPTVVEAPPRDPLASAPEVAAGSYVDSGPVDGKLWQLRSAGMDVRRFRDLTTLQQWIVEKKALRDDEISRNGDRWKRIGGIPELAPFFRIVEQAALQPRSLAAQNHVDDFSKTLLTMPVPPMVMDDATEVRSHRGPSPTLAMGGAMDARPAIPSPTSGRTEKNVTVPAPASSAQIESPPMSMASVSSSPRPRRSITPDRSPDRFADRSPPIPPSMKDTMTPTTAPAVARAIQPSPPRSTEPLRPMSVEPFRPRRPTGTQPVGRNTGPIQFSSDISQTFEQPAEAPEIEDELTIAMRRPAPPAALAVAAVMLLVGGLGYLAVYKRAALGSWVGGDSGARGLEAYRQGREFFLLDTDEDFERADQQLRRAQGADEANPLPIATLVEVNVTAARWLREDARVDAKPSHAAELRKAAQARLDDARRYASEARALAPSNPIVNRAMADFLCVDGAPAAQVEEFLRRSEAERPDDSEVQYVRGALMLRENRDDAARPLLERANHLNQLQTQRDLLRADYLLATSAAGARRWGDARAALQRILATSPHHRRAQQLLASLDAAAAAPVAAPPAPAEAPPAPVAAVAPAAKTPEPSAPTAETSRRGDTPSSAPSEAHGYDALVAAAEKLMDRHKRPEAIKLFEKALADQPDGITALNGIAYGYLYTEHYHAATDRFRQVLGLMPNNGEALYGLAETYKARGETSRALSYYQQYLSELPNGSKSEMAARKVSELQALEEAARNAPPPASPPPPP